jgi:hypothetical protein
MGKRNYLIEGVSGTGKSSVCQELRRRGYVAIDGDRELAYQGDPTTGEKTEGCGYEHHMWDGEKVKKTYPAVASYKMQHSRLSASWTKSLAMSELRLDSERSKRFVLIHFLICYSRSTSFSCMLRSPV